MAWKGGSGGKEELNPEAGEVVPGDVNLKSLEWSAEREGSRSQI